jgi:hypothetical protein
VARSNKAPAPAKRSAADTEAAALQALQQSAKALTKNEIVEALVARGFGAADVEAGWGALQKRLRSNGRVVVEKEGRVYRYLWNVEPPRATEAFERIVNGRLAMAEKETLIELVRKALAEPWHSPAPRTDSNHTDMDAARALAEMAIEVEELAAKNASARAMIHRVRARMKRMRLEPIDQAGEQVTFDRQRHQPIGPDIRDGTPVVVVRPGYVWKTSGKDVLIERPVVQD